ncbi:MAG: adenylyl-sulfate kinase [Deltaproteobacteria bacterium]|nr:adenylyl-sulfate kinase [Deltaproteobacteria bacterium]
MVRRDERELLLGQKGLAVWMTGLSGAGKTTLARAVERRLHDSGRLAAVLDGDVLRAGLNANLGFSDADRAENIRRVAETARLLVSHGVIVVVATISPTENLRALARGIVGEADLLEVFVHCPLEVCERRDVKGLYRRARSGELSGFTGVSAPFDAPAAPALTLHTESLSIDQAAGALLEAIAARATR